MNRPNFRTAASWLGLLGLICAAPQVLAQTVITVGTQGNGCQYSSIQTAINAAASGTEIHIQAGSVQTGTVTWSSIQLVINGKNLTIIGGYINCSDSAPTQFNRTQLAGTGSSSVIDVQGASDVTLENLEITGGGGGSTYGGGALYEGSGSLTVTGSWLHNNSAVYGGGLAVKPTGIANTLTLQNTTVSGNSASEGGGGLYLSGYTSLYSDATTDITSNTASTSGGGVYVSTPAAAYISSTINTNTANYGGGIYSSAAYVGLFSSSATQPVSIYGNTASESGGGIYLLSSKTVAATLCAQDFSIDANTAGNGSAIYAAETANTTNLGSSIQINPATTSCAGTGSPFPAVACATGPSCNEIADNTSGNATSSNTILISKSSELFARRVAARRNHGVSLIDYQPAINSSALVNAVELHECLLADNVMTGPLITTGSGGNVQMIVDTCTIVNNAVDYGAGPPYTISTALDSAQLTNSIIDDAGAQVIDFTGPAGGLTGQYMLVNSISTLPNTAYGSVQGTPTFADASNQDYHLTYQSLGIDYAPAVADFDLDGNPRPVDLPCIKNVFGPTDLGAYELQSDPDPDVIFCSGFEVDQ